MFAARPKRNEDGSAVGTDAAMDRGRWAQSKLRRVAPAAERFRGCAGRLLERHAATGVDTTTACRAGATGCHAADRKIACGDCPGCHGSGHRQRADEIQRRQKHARLLKVDACLWNSSQRRRHENCGSKNHNVIKHDQRCDDSRSIGVVKRKVQSLLKILGCPTRDPSTAPRGA